MFVLRALILALQYWITVRGLSTYPAAFLRSRGFAGVVLTGADHLLLLRLASELWVRLKPRGPRAAGGPGAGPRTWRRRLLLSKWLLIDGFITSGWMFR